MTRLMEAKVAGELWRDMGATTPKRLRQEFMKITKRIVTPCMFVPCETCRGRGWHRSR